MIRRLATVAQMTLLEAVRSRLLLAIGLVHLAGTAYAALLAALSLGEEARVIVDVSLASFSLVALVLVVVQASTSVDLDVRRKAVLTILTRALHRGEWILGKYLGIVAALALFGAAGAALSVATAGLVEGSSSRAALAACLAGPALAALVLPRIPALRSVGYALPLVACAGVFLVVRDPGAAVFARGAALALLEASLVAAIALFFATFSGPVPTAIFTVGVVLVGRSADTLAKLPLRSFPESVVALGRVLARALPNLHVYTPPRSVLAGVDPSVSPAWLLGQGALYAAAWIVFLVTAAALVTDRRDLG
jgi:ABC-type transport system involved in multi-copper enzyme maturation permease subunit